MPGTVTLHPADAAGVARLVLANPAKRGAIDTAMWRALRSAAEALAADPAPPRVVLVHGTDGDFASGGDIAEFPAFRFDAARLEAFHEELVAPALRALLALDVPLVARIEGACIGGGLEVAACCDIRLAGAGARFGIPVARLGFPLAPGEAAIVRSVLGDALLRELLIDGRLLDAGEAGQRGIVSRVLADDALHAEAEATCARIAGHSPQALRLDKRLLRLLAARAAAGAGPLGAAERAPFFAYADSAEHREGLAAFLERRAPRF